MFTSNNKAKHKQFKFVDKTIKLAEILTSCNMIFQESIIIFCARHIYDRIRGLTRDCAPSTNMVVPVRYLEPLLIK